MSYTPNTDFLALLRSTGGGVRTERMPGLDYVVSALARAGLITLFVGQTAPTVNQATTVWFQPAVPSWTAEGVVFLWNPAVSQFQPATPVLWSELITGQLAAVPNRIVTASGAFTTTLSDAGGSIGLNRVTGLGVSSTVLPANAIAGQTFTYQDIAGNFGSPSPIATFTVIAPAAATIAGLAEVVLNVNRQSATFTCYGSGVWGYR